MDKNKKIEIVMPLFFIAFAIYIIDAGRKLPSVEGYFPMMIGAAMLISALVILGSSLKSAKSVIAIEKINVLNIAKSLVTLLIYFILLPRIGYFASTVLLGIVIIRILGYKNKLLTVIYPIVIVTALFFTFKILLMVPLPVSFLEFL
jgi:hypothetical protein